MKQFPNGRKRRWRAIVNEMLASKENSSIDAVAKRPIQIYEVFPQDTDIAIDDWLEPHQVVLDQSVTLRNKLVVFFPGSFGKAMRQQLIIRELARLGYHTINLSYPNSWTIGSLCRHHTDPGCLEKVRLEIISGRGCSDVLGVGRPNSIENRLVKLLEYLDLRYPQQEWGQYLDGTLPKWGQIIVTGHSQGGGHAALLGKQHRVARVVMLAAPADFSWILGESAPWLSVHGQTPSERYYGFAHIKDEGYERIQKAWELLGITAYGPIINVDEQQPPYNHSHCLITDIMPDRLDKYHGSVATDGPTPKFSDGTPVFRQVWRYLFST
jgi:pimeloyl-ACP methyl ester carboxylesterase